MLQNIVLGKGASIKEVSSDVEVGRKQKFEIWGDFQGLSGVSRGGKVVKNHEKLEDVFYGWSLMLVQQ